MSIKRRIWALPVISTVIFGIGLAVSVSYSTTAISLIKTTEQVDFPALEQSKSLSAQVQDVVDSLKDAVTEGDKKRLEAVEDNARKVRETLKTLNAMPGKRESSDRLGKEFEAYYAPATSVARIMMNVEQGDPQAAIGTMQSANAFLWNMSEFAYAVLGVPTKVSAALSAGAADTVWNAPDVMICGAIVMVRLPEPSEEPFALTTNCFKNGSVALVTGLTS